MASFRKCRYAYLKIGTIIIICIMVFEVFLLKRKSFSLNINVNSVSVTVMTGKHSVSSNNTGKVITTSTPFQNSLSTCKSLMKNKTDILVTEALLRDVINVCLQTNLTDKDTLKGDHFLRLFADDNIDHVTCATRLIGPPSNQEPIAALASMKGTGTAWIRHLLEHLTFIQTGSLYAIKDNWEFLGEFYCPAPGNMSVVETHEFDTQSGHVFKPECRRIGIMDVPYSKAIYVVRNPFNTIVNDYYRQIRTVSSDSVPAEFSSLQWRQVIRQQTEQWLHHVTWWLSSFNGPVHVIVYENLIEEPFWEIYKVVRFLDHPVTLHSLKCFQKTVRYNYVSEKESWMSHANMFVPATTEGIRSAVKILTPLLSMFNIPKEIIHSYISFDEFH